MSPFFVSYFLVFIDDFICFHSLSGVSVNFVVYHVFFRTDWCALVYMEGLVLLEPLGWMSKRSCVFSCLINTGLPKILREIGIDFSVILLDISGE